jgi:N-methylhydantoinase B/oxoprolinase/acetone carboxylase alpha subunit
VVRDIEFLRPLSAGILSERRAVAPFGLLGGGAGQRGLNLLVRRDGRVVNLGGKATVKVEAGGWAGGSCGGRGPRLGGCDRTVVSRLALALLLGRRSVPAGLPARPPHPRLRHCRCCRPAGDRIQINTPGAGAYGAPEEGAGANGGGGGEERVGQRGPLDFARGSYGTYRQLQETA